ncbi:hypothetical protein SDC9_192993 [bioreactor metagenome]|uniref:EamA domain-containing protein n=1 Tax=bioreactor metagenome TaxID=1076179 RepID=A0A645I3H8_9ZZZZ
MGMVFPLVFLFLFGLLAAQEGPYILRELIARVVGLTIMTGSFMGQGMGLAVQRERGMLRRYRLTPLGATGLLGGAALVVSGLLMGGTLHFAGAGSVLILLYLALISAVAYTLWALLLKHNPVSRVAVFGFMIPVFGVLFSTLFLKESGQSTTAQTVFSLALVSAGIIIINKFRPRAPLDKP